MTGQEQSQVDSTAGLITTSRGLTYGPRVVYGSFDDPTIAGQAVGAARAESRLGAEYDPAEHHDLDRIEPPTASHPTWTAFCACGWSDPWSSTRSAAYTAWDQHRHQEWFG